MKKSCIHNKTMLLCFLLFIITNSQVGYAAKDDITQLKTSIANIETKVDNNSSTIRDFKRIAGYFIAVIVFVGFGTWLGIGAYIRKKVTKAMDKAIYKVDPTYLEIKIPSGDFDHEAARLSLLGFKNLQKYSWLDESCTSGCVIYKADNDERAAILQKFLQDKKLNEYKVGFILYTRTRINHTLFEEFNNVTFANSPLTLINAVYVVARGIVR